MLRAHICSYVSCRRRTCTGSCGSRCGTCSATSPTSIRHGMRCVTTAHIPSKPQRRLRLSAGSYVQQLPCELLCASLATKRSRTCSALRAASAPRVFHTPPIWAVSRGVAKCGCFSRLPLTGCHDALRRCRGNRCRWWTGTCSTASRCSWMTCATRTRVTSSRASFRHARMQSMHAAAAVSSVLDAEQCHTNASILRHLAQSTTMFPTSAACLWVALR